MSDAPANLNHLFEQTSDCLVFFEALSSRRFVLKSFNPAAAAALRLDAGCVGRSLYDLLPADAVAPILRSFQLCLDAGTSTSAEHCLPTPAGPRWYHAVLTPLHGPGRPSHRLAVAWRDVTAQKSFEQHMSRREEMFRRLVETAGVIPWEADFPTHRFSYLGPQAVQLLGYPLEQGYAEGFWTRILHPDDHDEAVATSARLADSCRSFALEYRLLSADGEVLWVRDLVNVVVHRSGLMLSGFLVDITALRKAEEEARRLAEQLEVRVTQRTAELAAANRELEAFCYSVSHDLRAPLRSIDGFSKALLEDYERRLDDDGRDMLRRVRAASQRMAELIDHLLTLSRVSRGEMHRTPVNLSKIAHAVAAALQQQAPERHVTWIIQPDLTADADPALARLLLENLLGNAFKYTSRHDTARIELGQTAGPAFFVRDDGAGFDEQYAAKLFQPFGRLHRPDEFDGHGIGLATVQRIVHRHGGQVAATGAVEQGATITFTL